jgi:hypothetical protein
VVTGVLKLTGRGYESGYKLKKMALTVLHAASIFWQEPFNIRVKQNLFYSGIRNVYQHNKAHCFLSSPTTTTNNSIQFFIFIYVLSSTANGQLLSRYKYEQQQQDSGA